MEVRHRRGAEAASTEFLLKVVIVDLRTHDPANSSKCVSHRGNQRTVALAHNRGDVHPIEQLPCLVGGKHRAEPLLGGVAWSTASAIYAEQL